MTNDSFTAFDRDPPSPGILSGSPSHRRPRSNAGPSRFVTQSHSLGAPGFKPQALVLGAMIAVALVVFARRLGE